MNYGPHRVQGGNYIGKEKKIIKSEELWSKYIGFLLIEERT